MELFRLAIAIVVVTGIGWNILYLILPRSGRFTYLERISIAYGLGIGLVTLEMLGFYFLKIELNPIYILAPWIVIFIIAIPFCAKNGGESYIILPRGQDKHRFIKIFLAIAVLLEAIYAFFRALIKPLESYDAIAIYAIKAKAIYFAKSIPHDFFSRTIKLFPHPDYPLNIPLAEAFGFISMRSWNDQLVKLIFPLYFLALLGLVYSSIRRFAGSTYALLFTFLVASVPQLTAYATNGYLDLVLGYYYFASASLIFLWFERESDIRFLIISAIMVGLAGWTKNEGLMYCIINVFLLAVFFVFEHRRLGLKEIRLVGLYAAIVIFINLPWMLIKAHEHIANSEIYLSRLNPVILVQQLPRIGPILYEFQKEFFGPKKWNILWPMALATFVFFYKKLFGKVEKYAVISLILIVSGYILIYMISILGAQYHVSKTWSRFLLHFLPVAVYLMARLLKDEVKL